MNSSDDKCKTRSIISEAALFCCYNSYHLLLVGVNFENKDLMSCKNLSTVNLLLVVSECAALLTNGNLR